MSHLNVSLSLLLLQPGEPSLPCPPENSYYLSGLTWMPTCLWRPLPPGSSPPHLLPTFLHDVSPVAHLLHSTAFSFRFSHQQHTSSPLLFLVSITVDNKNIFVQRVAPGQSLQQSFPCSPADWVIHHPEQSSQTKPELLFRAKASRIASQDQGLAPALQTLCGLHSSDLLTHHDWGFGHTLNRHREGVYASPSTHLRRAHPKPRNKPVYLQPTNIWPCSQEYSVEKGRCWEN